MRDHAACARGHRLGALAGAWIQRGSEHHRHLDAALAGGTKIVREEGRAVAPRHVRVAVAERDRHHGDLEPTCDPESAAPERRDARASGGGPLREVQDGDPGGEQVVDPAQGARACQRIVALDEHRAERSTDRTDQWPAADLALGHGQRGAHGQDGERIEVADVVGDDQRGAARHGAPNGDLEVMCAGDRTERTREPVGGGAHVARRRHPHRPELRQGVEQATSDVASGREGPHVGPSTWKTTGDTMGATSPGCRCGQGRVTRRALKLRVLGPGGAVGRAIFS